MTKYDTHLRESAIQHNNEAILANTAFYTYEPNDRKKCPTPILVRFMTLSEVHALVAGQTYEFMRSNDEKIGNIRITSIKRWRREPERLEIRVKYGLHEHTKWSVDEALHRFLVRIETVVK